MCNLISRDIKAFWRTDSAVFFAVVSVDVLLIPSLTFDLAVVLRLMLYLLYYSRVFLFILSHLLTFSRPISFTTIYSSVSIPSPCSSYNLCIHFDCLSLQIHFYYNLFLLSLLCVSLLFPTPSPFSILPP